jgi:hypothetical protein
MKSAVLLAMTIWLAACDSKGPGSSGSPASAEIAQRLIKTVWKPGVGHAEAKVVWCDEWDDGSGGEPEKIVAVAGEHVYLFVRDKSAGWREQANAGALVPEDRGILKGGTVYIPPGWVAFVMNGEGCLVGYKFEGEPRVEIYRFSPASVYKVMQRGELTETDAKTLDRVTDSLVKFIQGNYPDTNPDQARRFARKLCEDATRTKR